MIVVKRIDGSTPAALTKTNRQGKTELDRAVEHYLHSDNTASFDFDRYRNVDVKRALDEIFHGKCAYCESFYAKTQPVDVEHYRPKGKVGGADGHRGYWWLAMDWENLVPSCIDCNRKRGQRTPDPVQDDSMVELNEHGDFVRGAEFSSGKQSAFPLATGSSRAKWDTVSKEVDLNLEKPLLLDPTRDTPDDHIQFHVDRSDPQKLISIVYPRPLDGADAKVLPVLGQPSRVDRDAGQNGVSAIGAVSIQVYGLNRLSLVQARTRMLRDLEFLLELSISLQGLSSDIDDRVENRVTRIAASNGERRTQLEEDQQLDRRISARINDLSSKVVTQITDMAKPEAQFSALAKAWIKAFIDS